MRSTRLTTCLLTLSAAVLAQRPGPEMITGLQPGIWTVPAASDRAAYTIERDPLLGDDILRQHGPDALKLTSTIAYRPGWETTCRVRLQSETSASVVLNVAAQTAPPSDPGIEVRVYSVPATPHVFHATVKAAGQQATGKWDLKPYAVISPVMDRLAREPLEAAMAAAPRVSEKWIAIRCRTGDDWLRVWIDDRLLIDLQEPKAAGSAARFPVAGQVTAALSKGVDLAELSVLPVAPRSQIFEPIALDGYVNDRNLLAVPGGAVADGALAFGATLTVGGVPLQLVDRARAGGSDHLDLGRSLLRQANEDGYHPSSQHRFIGTAEVDPARIQLRIPNGRYCDMYLLAAADDGPGVPLLSASFYRPGAGFAKVFETTVPASRVVGVASDRVPVKLENGDTRNLWLVRIPLSPEALASFSDLDMLEVELTKQVRQYRSYPDPYIYGWHQAGLPSQVHVFAVTLQRPAIELAVEPEIFGHVWSADQEPAYIVQLMNRSSASRTVGLTATAENASGIEHVCERQTMTIAAGATISHRFALPVTRNGLHTVTVVLTDGADKWQESRNFCRLAPDTRAAKWTEGQGPLFGYWSYHGGHHTPPGPEIMRLMTMAGARASLVGSGKQPGVEALVEKHDLHFGPNAWPVSPQWDWADSDQPDPAKYNAYKTEAVDKLRQAQGDDPELVTFFAEPHISRDLTAGNLPSYWGEQPYAYNDQERKALRVFMNTSRAAAEGVRAAWPKSRILIPWGDPLFVVPLLREGFPKSLIDGSALDMIGFERLPEQQLHQMSTHRLYMLKEEYRRFGMDKPLLPYVEGTFVPTEPGACTWQEQANYYHRWALISLAYGIERFYSGWFAFDCGNYYGAEHYGGCGIQRRIPYCDPKPAYAHYATMTRMLDRANFKRWLPTGSHSTYCLVFERDGQPIQVLWTLRGKRPAHLTLGRGTSAVITDCMDNAQTVAAAAGSVTITTGEAPLYVTGAAVTAIALGAPDHTDAMSWSQMRNQQTWGSGPVQRKAPVATTLSLAHLGDGSWTLDDGPDELYETNNYDTFRYPGKMQAEVVDPPDHEEPALAVKLGRQSVVRQLMPWYTTLKPAAPVVIPGKSLALGLWVKAHSDWGRVIYSLRDANGERWVSIGTKDQWNCDDVHSWSSFNFDGWRYLRFEMPSHEPYDAFRNYGNTWWRHAGGDGVVDLPLSLEKIIVERRTHVLYVNDIQPADPADVLLGKLVAEYAEYVDATPSAVLENRRRMPLTETANLPNPIADMTGNALAPIELLGVRDPDWGYDGTRCHVDFTSAKAATVYQVWVAAHDDGRGAQAMGKFTRSGELLQQLRPAVQLYLWVTYTDQDGNQSQPSNRLGIKLVDGFGQK